MWLVRGSSFLTAIFLIGTFAVAGCGALRNSSDTPNRDSRLASALQDIGGAPASFVVAESMRPFFAAGLVLLVLGGISACLGGRGVGFALMGIGFAATATGVLFVQYPWSVLLLVLAALAAAALTLWDRLRTGKELTRNREALALTAEVVQNIPEGRAVKVGLAGFGGEVESRLRAVIDPIKEDLRKEGRIK